MSRSNLLFVLSGSIAAYKACDALSQLVQRGHQVRVVATPAALRFVGAATLEGLTRQPVVSDLWAAGSALDHIDLTRWADLVVVCPATASLLNRLATGLADDLVGALFLASDRGKPWLVAPAMNPAMWQHPATVASVEKLRAWGVRFLAVGHGRTACGEFGDGRLAEPDDIVAAVEQLLAPPGGPHLRVLITSGGTAEPIDGVRVITNTSTGETGALLAHYFATQGHEVVLLRAVHARAVPSVREYTFRTHADLSRLLAERLGAESFDVVIHAAAVSDFRVARILAHGQTVSAAHKIPSEAAVQLELAPQAKLVDQLRGWSHQPRLRIVAFKLTDHASATEARAAVARLFATAHADFVVHNDLAQLAPDGAFPATIFSAVEAEPTPCASRGELAVQLEKLLRTTS